jgi:glycosyltransferase involved in cell wall biosynthesis
MQRIRVLQLVTGLATGEQVGGAELFGIQLARSLAKDSFDCAVLGLWQYGSRREKEWISILESENICAKLLTAPAGHLVSDLGRAFSGLWSVVKTFRPHIINSHSERTDSLNMLMHILHPAHPHSVRTMHTDEQWQNRPWVGAVLINLVFPFAFDVEVAISKAVRRVLDERLVARLTRKKSILCYNGVDAAIFDMGTSSRSSRTLPDGIPDQGPRIGIVGRLAEQKGHRYLFEAMKMLLQTRPVHLLVIGSGPLETDLGQQVSRLEIQEFVHFLGSRNDVLESIPCLDLIVSSSLWEGFPTVLLEAMALGIPAVATDVSGSRELVRTEETGILVPPRNPMLLAEAILDMLGDPAAARSMAENARKLARQFTVQNAASQYAQVYRQITNVGP